MFIVFAAFISTSLSAAPNVKVSFKREARLTQEIYFIDAEAKGTPLECAAYANKNDEGIKLRLDSPRGLEFAFDCRAGEAGDRFDLLVYKDSRSPVKIKGVVSKGSDCDVSFESQAWLKDLNGDKETDLVTRSKYKKVDGECGGGGSNRILDEQDDMKVYYWKSGTLSEAKVPEEKLKSLKKECDFSL